MDIEVKVRRTKRQRKWIAEIWSDDVSEPLVQQGFKEPYSEDTYQEINQWCVATLGYPARTAYHVFEFNKQSDFDWFVLRWS